MFILFIYSKFLIGYVTIAICIGKPRAKHTKNSFFDAYFYNIIDMHACMHGCILTDGHVTVKYLVYMDPKEVINVILIEQTFELSVSES